MGGEFLATLNQLVEQHGTTLYVSLALDELGLTTVQEIKDPDFFVRRVVALEEESR